MNRPVSDRDTLEAARTPLERAPESLADRRELYFKREDAHELGAFKWRGALPTLLAYRNVGAERVVTASTGNHGAATAWAARRIGLGAVVFVPEGASATKLDVIRRNGAEIREFGRDLDAAKDEARRFAEASAVPFFEDGAEPAQYEGYASIAEEILDQLGRQPAAIVAPVGNGALIAGIGRGLARRDASATKLFGVAAKEAPVMALSFEAGRPVPCDRIETFADGLAVRVAIPSAVAAMLGAVSRVVLVSEREIARAVSALARSGIRAEGASAAALAALDRIDLPDGPVVAVLTGRNIDTAVYERAVSAPESFPK
jgi:threonine dehydratase